MAKKKISVIWSTAARKELLDILEYINNKSAIGAEIVLDEIISKVNSLPQHPEKYPPDNLRWDKDKSFRAFTVFNYRITYRITSKAIYIYRIRHSSREPLSY